MSVVDIKSLEQFEEVIAQEGVQVIKISTSTCMPCKALAPIFSKIAEEETEHSFYSITDPSEYEGVANKVNELNISSVPTTLVYTDGVLTSRVTGAHPKAVFLTKLGL